jgi:hypothetical protein
MSDFVFLFRGGLANASPAEMQAHMEKWGVWMKELGDKGAFQTGKPLERSGKVVRGKQKSVTDGPFAEAKDLVGGFMLIAAKDVAHAVELSKGCPILEVDGTVEVRPVMLMTR